MKLSVKVKYLQLSRAVSEKEEDYFLDQGSCYSDLLAAVLKRHPSLTHIAKIVLLDGVPAAPAISLNNGDEICFVASPAGG